MNESKPDAGTSAPKSAGRLTYLDAAKGVAIILVVVGHLVTCGEPGMPHDGFLRGIIHSYHMPAFFAVAGMTLASGFKRLDAGGRLRHELAKTAKRLLPAYFVWHAIYLAMNVATVPGYDPANYLVAMITFRGVAPIWFLGALWMSKSALVASYWCIRGIERKTIALAAFTCAFFALSLVASYVGLEWLSGTERYLALALVRCFPCMFFMLAGYWLKRGIDMLESRKLSPSLCILASCALIAVVPIVQVLSFNGPNLQMADLGDHPVKYLLLGVAGSTGIVALLYFLCELGFKARLLAWCGRLSLGIMLVHYRPFPFIPWCAAAASWIGGGNIYVDLALATVFVMAVSSLTTVLIQKKLFI